MSDSRDRTRPGARGAPAALAAQPSGFNLRPLGRSAEPPPPTPNPAPPAPQVLRRPAEQTGAVFRGPAGALNFLNAVAQAGLARQPDCRLGPDGLVFVTAPVPARQGDSLVRAAGGRPDSGEQAARWPQIDPVQLLAAVPLRTIPLAPRSEVYAFIPEVLSRWVLTSSLTLALDVAVCAAERQPLLADERQAGGVWLRLRARSGKVPLAWVSALRDLPGALVAYPVGSAADRTPAPPDEARLLVDVLCAAPAAATLVLGRQQSDAAWVLAAADAGHARICTFGPWTEGASLVSPPAVPMVPVRQPGAAALPQPVPVRVVRRAISRPADGVLLEPRELPWLRVFLQAQPASDGYFLACGSDWHLLLAQGGLVAAIPFGIEVCRIGPGGLYLAQGLDLLPPLTPTARQSLFCTDKSEALVLHAAGALRFRVDTLVPVWTLWAGPPPAVCSAPPPTIAAELQALAARLQPLPAVASQPPAAAAQLPVESEPPTDELARRRLEAARCELAGELEQAAEILEHIGDFAAAGRLYERAADKLRTR